VKRVNVTPVGRAVLVALLVALAAVLFGSSGVQLIGFVLAALIVLALASDQLTSGSGRSAVRGRGRSIPTPAHKTLSETEEDRRGREAAWQREEARYRARQEQGD
jgi:hypothetical protein